MVRQASADPEIFFVKNYSCAKTPLNTFCEPKYIYSEDETSDLNVRIAAQVEKIAKNAGSGSEYERVLHVHDILCANIQYVNDCVWNRHTVVGAFVDRKAVCDGFAKAFKMVMDRMGFKCLVIFGSGSLQQSSADPSHAWNLVKINGEWRHVDVAFDARDNWKNERIYDYFSLTDEQIKRDHIFDSGKYPEASGSKNDYYTAYGLMMRGKEELRNFAVSNIRNGITTFSVSLPDNVPDGVIESKVLDVLTNLPLGNGAKYRVNLGCNTAQHIFRIQIETAAG